MQIAANTVQDLLHHLSERDETKERADYNKYDRFCRFHRFGFLEWENFNMTGDMCCYILIYRENFFKFDFS